MLLKYKYIHLFLLLALALLAYKKGSLYSYADIKDVLSTLQNISAMIFTIAGIWLAYIYPKAISAMVKPSNTISEVLSNDADKAESISVENKIRPVDKDSINKDITRITIIVETIIISALVILAIVFINIFKPIIVNFSFFQENILALHVLGCFTSLALVYFQLISLFTIILSNVIFLNDMHNEKNKNELNQLK
ncbi:hypothetical protein [Pluralibacter gergoviae]|uniref:hypothetical protein n=1 Tax=Pluralibacter gergoviae TaxID=61647 RepID=UPI00155F3B49|nr:hypothetical protein [Pluralibacter gergoviae]MDU4002704.1 hypothetical protein [Pluralibacter gergoviae]